MAIKPYQSEFAQPIKKDSRDVDLQKQFGQMKDVLGAQRAEAQRQGDILYKQALASSGGFGGAGLKIGQKAKLGIEKEYGQQQQMLGAQEAEARQNLASMKSQEALQRQQLNFAEWYGKQELDENKRTNVINAYVAFEKAGIKDPEKLNKLSQMLWGQYGTRLGSSPSGPMQKVRRGKGFVWVNE